MGSNQGRNGDDGGNDEQPHFLAQAQGEENFERAIVVYKGSSTSLTVVEANPEYLNYIDFGVQGESDSGVNVDEEFVSRISECVEVETEYAAVDEIDVEIEELDEAEKPVDEVEIETNEATTNNYISSMGVCFDNEWIEKEAENEAEGSSVQPDSPNFFVAEGKCKGLIISWKYVAEMKLFAIKRTVWIQYFEKSMPALSSLPKCEINHLAQINLINRENNT